MEQGPSAKKFPGPSPADSSAALSTATFPQDSAPIGVSFRPCQAVLSP